jgi:hypothetical protein
VASSYRKYEGDCMFDKLIGYLLIIFFPLYVLWLMLVLMVQMYKELIDAIRHDCLTAYLVKQAKRKGRVK